MILSLEQIKAIIDKPLALGLTDARENQAIARTLISGDGFIDNLKRQSKLESEANFELKKALCKPETPRVFKQILNQYKKVFRAKGFIRQYDFNGDTNYVNEFTKQLENVYRGMSIEEFMQKVWFKAIFEDWNCVFLTEINTINDEVNANINVVPTSAIHDILVKGNKIEYLVIKSDCLIDGKKHKKYRVIDDSFDYVFISNGKDLKINTYVNTDGVIVEDVLPNYWGYVPAIQCSTIIKDLKNETIKSSYLDTVFPLAEQYQDLCNSHYLSVKLHQHPIFYSYPTTCGGCNGSGKLKNDNCNTCNGTGIIPIYKKDLTQGISLPEPLEGEPYKAEAPCGYVAPDLPTLIEQRNEIDILENKIEKGALGVEGILVKSTKNETATGKELDLQPLLDMLSDFAKNGQIVEQFLTDCIGDALYNDVNNNTEIYKGCKIVWGQKFFIKSAETINKEFAEAKISGIPSSLLLDYLHDNIYTKYENNSKYMSRALMLLELEPLPTYAIDDVKDIINKDDLILKIYFNDFIERFERENGSILYFKNELEYASKLNEITKVLYVYVAEKMGGAK